MANFVHRSTSCQPQLSSNFNLKLNLSPPHLVSRVCLPPWLQQVPSPTHRASSPSHWASPPPRVLGPTSAPSATRTRWTRSSTPAATCVSATPADWSSRRCPTPAVPSAGDRSKTSSRPTAARSDGTQEHSNDNNRCIGTELRLNWKDLVVVGSSGDQDGRFSSQGNTWFEVEQGYGSGGGLLFCFGVGFGWLVRCLTSSWCTFWIGTRFTIEEGSSSFSPHPWAFAFVGEERLA